MTAEELKLLAHKAAQAHRDKAALYDQNAQELDEALEKDDQGAILLALVKAGALVVSPWGQSLLESPIEDLGVHK